MNIHLPQFKVIFVGDYGVGKTSLVRRCVDDTFRVLAGAASPSLRTDYAVANVELDDGMAIDMQLWDTAGEERHGSVPSSYYRNAHAVVFVYDTESPASLETVQKWIAMVDKQYKSIPVRMLVGTKCDMIATERTDRGASALAETSRMDAHVRVSSLDGSNVPDVLLALGEKLRIKAVEKALEDAEHLQSSSDPMVELRNFARETRSTFLC